MKIYSFPEKEAANVVNHYTKKEGNAKNAKSKKPKYVTERSQKQLDQCVTIQQVFVFWGHCFRLLPPLELDPTQPLSG